MGIRGFWSLILLLALTAAVLHWSRDEMPRPLPISDEGTNAVLVEPPEAAPPVVKQPPFTPLTQPKPAPEHVASVQIKTPAPPPSQGGTVEREESPRLVRMADGSLIVDNYWTVAGGDGSAENPYRLTWDLLLSAQSSFDPAAPKLPDRLKFLEGKFVVLKGYTLKSQTSGAVAEFLLNDQLMDNCPICTARSVFATVSVKAKAPENLERGVINVFTVRGQFKVDAVIRAGFLLGVYFLNDAEVISRTH